MKVIILAGGYGTRLGNYTKKIPKPMIKIGNVPIILHIIKHYLKHGFNDFYIATGYKSKIIKKFFKSIKKNFKIKIVYTGRKTLTGGRLRRMKKFLNQNENFMFTYGDGISSVDLTKLKKFHLRHKKLITVTAVRPPARFGEIIIKKNFVVSFKEKPQVNSSWINGGFFVANRKFVDLIKKDTDILEKTPLEKASKSKQLMAFQHKGFWKCLDVKRDKDELEKIYKKNKFYF